MTRSVSLFPPTISPSLRRAFCAIAALFLVGLSGSTALAQPMRGVYTVGGVGSNFPTPSVAASAITNRGAASHVTFLIRSGTYNVATPLLIGAIAGAGPEATVTFRPDAGATVRISSNLSGRGTITLRGAGFVTFEGRSSSDTVSRMTITNTNSGAGSCAVLLDSNTDNSGVRHCTVVANGSGESGACIRIRGVSGGCGSDSSLIEANVLGDVNGTYRADCGVLIEGGSAGDPNCNRGTVVRGNTIINMGRSGSQGFGVRVEAFSMGTTIANNAITITRPTGVISLTAISDNSSASDAGNNCRIDGNRIWGLSSTAQQMRTYIGIAIAATEAGRILIPTSVVILNNMVSMTINGRREEAHAISVTAYNAGSQFSCAIDFNTVFVRDTSARDDSFTYTYTTPLDIFTVTSNGRPQIRHRNNIWDVALNGGEGWHIEADNCDFASDRNLVSIGEAVDPFSWGVNFRNNTAEYSGAWSGLKAATVLDHNSIEGQAEFANPALGDLHIVQCGTFPGANLAQTLSGITLDIDGEERLATPDIGADETRPVIAFTTPAVSSRVLAERPFDVWYTVEKDMWVSVDISCDGTNWQTLGTYEGFAGFSNVATPNAPAAPCAAAMIRLRGSDGRSCTILGTTVNIYRPTVQVEAPNGGEHYLAGDSVFIRWNSRDADKVRIEYRSTQATAGLWSTIATNVPASAGAFHWGVPNISDTTYQVRVVVTSPIAADDTSDAQFTVEVPTPEITVIAPNGGEVLVVDSTTTLRWNVENITGRGVLEWSHDSGTTWLLVDTVEDVTAQSYEWRVPNKITTRALLRARALDAAVEDVSDRTWSILNEEPEQRIIILHPNGGEVLGAPSSDSIVWVAPPDVNAVLVQYSTDGGAQWSDVSGSAPSVAGRNSLEWRIPGLPVSTSSALVRVMAIGTPMPLADTSDATFTLSPNAGVVSGLDIVAGVVVSPNPAHENITVRWNALPPTELRLRSVNGVSVWSGSVPPGSSTFTLRIPAELPAGLYLLEYTAAGRTAHLPVTVVR